MQPTSPVLPAQPARTPFRGCPSAWTVALFLLAAGCAGSKHAAVERQSRLEMARSYSADVSGDALLVWIGGSLVLEDYPQGYNPEQPHILTEASTLFAGLTALAALSDGLLTLDEPVSETITEWNDDPRKSAVTISELLHLVSGLDAGSYRSPPVYDKAIAAPLVDAPGEAFRYGPTAFQVFGAVIARKAGSGYFMRRVLEPLGIPGERWLAVDEVAASSLSGGAALTPRHFDGAHLTPHELGRLGRLLLQGGRWNDEVIFGDVSPLTEPAAAAPGYGLTVWLNVETGAREAAGPTASFLAQVPERIMLPPGSGRLIYDGAPPDLYMAAGRYNQRLYVIPSTDMVIVRLGRDNVRWDDAEFLARLLDGRSLYPPAPPEPD